MDQAEKQGGGNDAQDRYFPPAHEQILQGAAKEHFFKQGRKNAMMRMAIGIQASSAGCSG